MQTKNKRLCNKLPSLHDKPPEILIEQHPEEYANTEVGAELLGEIQNLRRCPYHTPEVTEKPYHTAVVEQYRRHEKKFTI